MPSPDVYKGPERRTAVPSEVRLTDETGAWLEAKMAAAVRGAIEAQWFKLEEVGGGIQAAREQAKAQRQAAVDAIKVTTQAGNTFDGDEVSQTRMTRAVLAMQATGTPSVTWVLADNTVIQATATELTEALALAGAEQARLWVIE